MNGFEMMYQTYKSMVDSGRMTQEEAAADLKVYQFLGTCSEEEIYKLFDTSAFNDVVKEYVSRAIDNAKADKEVKADIMNELSFLFEMKTAAEIMQHNLIN